jgi:hypothetical protein
MKLRDTARKAALNCHQENPQNDTKEGIRKGKKGKQLRGHTSCNLSSYEIPYEDG